MFDVVLYEPKIAPNTGNIIRLVANNGCHLHLIEPLGFDLEEKGLRRAGLDYHDLARVTLHASYADFLESRAGCRVFAITTKGKCGHHEPSYQAGDILLFGSETSGLPDEVHQSLPDEQKIRIPMLANARSLNLSNAVSIVSYEAWRQLGFQGSI